MQPHRRPRLIPGQGRGDPHPRPRQRIILRREIKGAPVVEQGEKLRLPHEARGIADQRGEQVGEIVDREARVVELGLQQIPVAQGGLEAPGQADVLAVFLDHLVGDQQVEQEPPAGVIEAQHAA